MTVPREGQKSLDSDELNSFIYFRLFGFENGAAGDNNPLFACSRVSEHYRLTTCFGSFIRDMKV